MKNCKRIGLLIGLMSCFLVFGCKDDLTQKMPDLKKSQNVSNSENGLKEGYTQIIISGSASMTPPKPKNVTRSGENHQISFDTRISEENQDYLIDWTKMKGKRRDMGMRLAIAVVSKETKKVEHVEYVYLSYPEIKRKNDNLTGDDVDRNGYYMYFPAYRAQNDGVMPTEYLKDKYEYYASGCLYKQDVDLFGIDYAFDEETLSFPIDPNTGEYIIRGRTRLRHFYRGDITYSARSFKSLSLNGSYAQLEYKGGRFFVSDENKAGYPVTSAWTKISRGSRNHFDFNIFLKPRGTMLRFNVKNNLYSTVNFLSMKIKTNAFVPTAQFSQDIPVGANIADYEGREISWKVPEEKDLYLKSDNGLYEFAISSGVNVVPAFGYDYYEAKKIKYEENASRNTSGYLYTWVMPTDAPGRTDDGVGKGGGKRTIKIKPLVLPSSHIKGLPLGIGSEYNIENAKGLLITPDYRHLYHDMFLPKDETIIEHSGNGSDMWIKEAFNYSLRLKPIESDLMITQIVSADRSTRTFAYSSSGSVVMADGFNVSREYYNRRLTDSDEPNFNKTYSWEEQQKIMNKGLNLTMVTLYNPTNKTIDLREYGLIRAWFDPKTKRNKFFNGKKGGGTDIGDALVQVFTTNGASLTPRVKASKGSVPERPNLNRKLIGSASSDLNLKPGQSIVICGGAFASYPWGLSPTNDIMFGYDGEKSLFHRNKQNNISLDNQIKNNTNDGSCLRAIAFDNAVKEQGWDRFLYNKYLKRLFSMYTYRQKGFGNSYLPYNAEVTRPLYYYYATEGTENNRPENTDHTNPSILCSYKKYGKNVDTGPLYPDAFKIINDSIPFEKAGVLSLRDMQGFVLMKKGEGGYNPLDACLVDITLTPNELNILGTQNGIYPAALQNLGRLFYHTNASHSGIVDHGPFFLFRHPGFIYPNLSFFKTPRYITDYEGMNTESNVENQINVLKEKKFPYSLNEGTLYTSWYSVESAGEVAGYGNNKSVFNDYWFGRRTGKSVHDAWMEFLRNINN